MKHYKPVYSDDCSSSIQLFSLACESGQIVHHLSINNGRYGHLLSPETFPGCKVAPKNKCFQILKVDIKQN